MPHIFYTKISCQFYRTQAHCPSFQHGQAVDQRFFFFFFFLSKSILKASVSRASIVVLRGVDPPPRPFVKQTRSNAFFWDWKGTSPLL